MTNILFLSHLSIHLVIKIIVRFPNKHGQCEDHFDNNLVHPTPGHLTGGNTLNYISWLQGQGSVFYGNHRSTRVPWLGTNVTFKKSGYYRYIFNREWGKKLYLLYIDLIDREIITL